MLDSKTLASINMHAILGSLQELCAFSPEAAELIRDRPPVIL